MTDEKSKKDQSVQNGRMERWTRIGTVGNIKGKRDTRGMNLLAGRLVMAQHAAFHSSGEVETGETWWRFYEVTFDDSAVNMEIVRLGCIQARNGSSAPIDASTSRLALLRTVKECG